MKINKKMAAGVTICLAVFLNSCGSIADAPFTTNAGVYSSEEGNFEVTRKKGAKTSEGGEEARPPKGKKPPKLNMKEIEEQFPEVAEALKTFHEAEKDAKDAKMDELKAAYPEFATYLEENKPPQREERTVAATEEGEETGVTRPKKGEGGPKGPKPKRS